MKSTMSTTLMAILLLAAQSAQARVIWDWDFVNPFNEVGQRATVVMNARITVDARSTEAFAWDGARGWAYLNSWPLWKAYTFSFGPAGGFSFFDQFRGVTIAPGESFDFVFGVLSPRNGLARVGSYTSTYQAFFLSGLGRRHNHYFQVDVPEPAAWGLLAAGLFMAPMMLAVRRRRAGRELS